MPVLCWQVGMWLCAVSAFAAERQADTHLFAVLRHRHICNTLILHDTLGCESRAPAHTQLLTNVLLTGL